MKTYILVFGLIVAVTITSCRKENVSTNVWASSQTQQKLESWFHNQIKAGTYTDLPVLGNNEPNWQQTQYNKEENLFITPIKLKDNKRAAKFFVTNEDGNGNFKSGRYYVILNKTGLKNSEAENILLGNVQKINFTGAVLEYDYQNRLINASHYDNGETRKKVRDIILHNPTLNKVKMNTAPNFVNPCEDEEPLCIDWYWQTYVNGELIEEEYLYTSCSCSNGGGGTSQSPSGNTACNMTGAQAQNVLNSISGTSTVSSGGLTLGNATIVGNKKRASIHGYGGGYKLNLVFGMSVEWESEYSGWAYKYINRPNDPWLFESIKYEGFPKKDGSATSCFTFQVSVVNSEQISADKKTAITNGSCNINATISCIAGLITTVHSGNFGSNFYSTALHEAN